MKVPKDLEVFFERIKTELPELLGDVLFGIYIYGSLSYGDFEEHRSDLDIIVVIKRELNKREFEKLKSWYDSGGMKQSRWSKRLEMDYAVLGNLVSDTKHGVKTIHFAGGKLHKKANSEADNPITWINIKDRGIFLFGPSPKEFVPEITDDLLLSALSGEFEDVKNNADKWIKINLWNQVYVVITLCRIFYTFHEKKLVSKKEAGRWCLKNLPEQFRSMVALALEKIDNSDGLLDETLTNGLPDLMNYVGGLFHELKK